MNEWSELVSRSELNAMYGITLNDREWENLRFLLDDAVALTVSEFLA